MQVGEAGQRRSRGARRRPAPARPSRRRRSRRRRSSTRTSRRQPSGVSALARNAATVIGLACRSLDRDYVYTLIAQTPSKSARWHRDDRDALRPALAQRPAGDARAGRAGLGIVEPARRRAATAASSIAGPAAERRRRSTRAEVDRLRGPLDHARPDRLPHPSRLRRRPRARIRAAARRRDLRGDRARRRRHRLDRRARPRAASEDELVAERAAAARRADRRGRRRRSRSNPATASTSTTERKIAARRAAARRERRDVVVRTTFLGAHALPPEFAGDATAISTSSVDDDAAGARAPRGWPTRSTPFARASPSRPTRSRACSTPRGALGLPVKLHADQLSNLRGAALAAALRRAVGRSSRISRRGRRRRDGAGGHRRGAAARRLLLPARDAGAAGRRRCARTACRSRVATDCNPGTSPLTSLLLAMNMAATLFRLTVDECLAGVTRDAARALGLGGEIGTLEAGKCVRSRDLGHRAAGRARLPHRLQPAACARLEGPMTDIILTPGDVVARRLARDLSRRRRRARSRLPRRASPRAPRRSARIVAARRAGLWHQHRLRQAGERADRRRRPRDAAAQHRAVATPPASASRCRVPIVAADDGAEAREPRAGRLRRAAGDARAARGDAGARPDAGRARARARSAPPAISRRSRIWRRR